MNKVLKTSAGITVNRTRLLSNKYLLKELRKRILKEVGKPCKDYYPFCFDCNAWRAYDTMVEVLRDTTRYKGR